MRWLSLNLALFACCLSPSALGAGRHIRSSLDDVAPSQPNRLHVLPESHADFPLTVEPLGSTQGRLIRLSLDDGTAVYGRLRQARSSGRRFRTSLD